MTQPALPPLPPSVIDLLVKKKSWTAWGSLVWFAATTAETLSIIPAGTMAVLTNVAQSLGALIAAIGVARRLPRPTVAP